MVRRREWSVVCVALTAGVIWYAPGRAQIGGGASGEWRAYGATELSTHYAPFDQVNRGNVKSLGVAWRWRFDNNGTPSETMSTETTPIMVGGVLYFTAGARRTVVAAAAGTGETLWTWRPDEGPRFEKAARRNHRGVAYWSDGRSARIIVVTPGMQLVALDAHTGRPMESFGEHGMVDLFRQLDNDSGLDPSGQVGNTSPPVVLNDVVIVGLAGSPGGTRVNKANVKLDVMAFNVRTGKKMWTFHTIPRKGEPGYETWLNGSAEYTGNAGVWAPFSADPSLGLVYLPVESATSDIYGGHRPGNNLYSSSVVALDARTGKIVWYQQLVHHDIWDLDPPAHPILIDITVDGRRIPALVQLTKQAWPYVFDRRNGEPVWPIVERPVPQNGAPGEWLSPTQPFPTKPAPFDRQGVSVDDLIDFTPELRVEALEAIRGFRIGPLFTPPGLHDGEENKGLISVPGFSGGANWYAGAADPDTGFVYVPSVASPTVIGLSRNDPAKTGVDADYVNAGVAPRVQGLPLLKPPYGRITAYDMNRGEIVWQIPNGDTPTFIKEHRALQGKSIPRTGTASHAGLLVTKTFLFGGEGPGGGFVFHAYDKATGADLAQLPLPGPQTALPMTYLFEGRQFIVVAVRGNAAEGFGAQLVAFALPRGADAQRGRGGRGGLDAAPVLN